jgi:hypothetical protein
MPKSRFWTSKSSEKIISKLWFQGLLRSKSSLGYFSININPFCGIQMIVALPKQKSF